MITLTKNPDTVDFASVSIPKAVETIDDKKYIIIHQDKATDFDTWFTMSKEKARILYHGRGGPKRVYMELGMYIDDNKMCISNKMLSLRMNPYGALYMHSTVIWGFTYDRKIKKVKKWVGESIELSQNTLDTISKHFINLEWLNDIVAFHHDLSQSSTLLGHVLSGKITNARDLIKKHLKLNARGINISPEVFYQYVKDHKYKGSFRRMIADARYCVNPDLLFRHDTRIDNIIDDMMHQARQLNRKIDLKWSEKRLDIVHRTWTREIMAYQFEGLPEFDVEYTGTLPELEGFELIGNQKKVFEIGSIEDHCIYSNYWNNIEQKEYFCMYGQYQNKCYTIGINRNRLYRIRPDSSYIEDEDSEYNKYQYVFELSQVQSKRNQGAPEELKELIKQWLKNPDVQKFFIDNWSNPKDKSIEVKDTKYYGTDFDF